MANRFLETNYFKSPFVRSLKGAIKGLYSFIICDCTPSGIWSKDLEAASMYIGFEVNDKDFIDNFISRGKAIDIGGNKFFFPDFIEHQYPKGLQENNAAHKNIIYELKKYSLIDEKNQVTVKKNRSPLQDPLKPLYSSQGYGNGIGNDNGKGNGYSNGQGNTEPELENLMNGQTQFIIPEMQKIWDKYKPNYSKDKFKDSQALQNIGNFILSQDKVKKDQRHSGEKIKEAWEIICKYVNETDFIKNYSLKQLDNNIQSVVTSIQNGHKSKSKIATGANVSTESILSKINSMPDSA